MRREDGVNKLCTGGQRTRTRTAVSVSVQRKRVQSRVGARRCLLRCVGQCEQSAHLMMNSCAPPTRKWPLTPPRALAVKDGIPNPRLHGDGVKDRGSLGPEVFAPISVGRHGVAGRSASAAGAQARGRARGAADAGGDTGDVPASEGPSGGQAEGNHKTTCRPLDVHHASAETEQRDTWKAAGNQKETGTQLKDNGKTTASPPEEHRKSAGRAP